MSSQNIKRRFRKSFGLSVLCSLASYHLGCWSHQTALSWFVVELGALGFFIAEVGAWLANDYYSYKRSRKESVPPKTLAKGLHPPQLALKGAWGLYLLAFLCALFLALAMAERGWVIMVFAFIGFFLGYYTGADPFYWHGFRWGPWVSAGVSSWLPFFVGSYVSGKETLWIQSIFIVLLYIGIVIQTYRSVFLFTPSNSAKSS